MRTKAKRAPRRHARALPVGGMMMVLAVIGLVSVIIASISFTSKLLDNTAEKQKFRRIIAPVMMFDPVPFERATDIDELQLLNSSLWAALYTDKRDSYAYDEVGQLILPASDVDVACSKLFGPEVKLVHQTFGDYEISYLYDEETQAYHVPVTGHLSVYSPEVAEISRKGDLYSLVVGYIPPGNAWTMDFTGNRSQPEPDKYMTYELKKVGSNYQLMAIKDPPPEYIPMLGQTPGAPTGGAK